MRSTGPAAGAASRAAGRPVVQGGEFEHSVSHSGDLVALAVARSPVGVDVERLEDRARPLGGDGDPASLARLVLADGERAALDALPPADRPRQFLLAWTRKEAITKATGMACTLPSARSSWPGHGARRGSSPGPTRSRRTPCPWWTSSGATGYVAALAVIGRCEVVLPRDGSALLAASSPSGREAETLKGLRCSRGCDAQGCDARGAVTLEGCDARGAVTLEGL